MNQLYVARDNQITAVSRGQLRMSGADPVRRNWRALTEVTAPVLTPKPPRAFSDPVLVAIPPVLTGSITVAFAPIEAGIAVGGAVFFAASYLAPILRRRATRRWSRSEVRLLSTPAERAAFQQAVDTADRIADTWPALGSLVDPADAEPLLAEALWEIAGVLTRRQELTALLATLNRPDFTAVPSSDRTARDLRTQVHATRTALTQLDADLSRREANLRRAEEAGRHFIRDQEMRHAIRAAEDSLRAPAPTPLPDPAANLAEQTQSVLTAYRELITGPQTNPPVD